MATLEGHTGRVSAVCAVEVGGRSLLASGARDNTVRLWDPATGRCDLVLPLGHTVTSLAAIPGGLAVGLSAGVLVVDIPAPAPGGPRGTAPPPAPARPLDFFVSYAQPDRPWAEWVAWVLEEAGHTVAVQAWDFRPGSDYIADMETALTRASRVVAVLSPAYLASAFAMAEWRAAFATDPTGRAALLLPVRVAECRPPSLHATRIYVDLVGVEEAGARTALLAAAQGDRAKPHVAPRFPSGSVVPAPRFPGGT